MGRKEYKLDCLATVAEEITLMLGLKTKVNEINDLQVRIRNAMCDLKMKGKIISQPKKGNESNH